MIDANTKVTENLELSDEDFKAVMIKMLQWAISNKLETNEKNRKSKHTNSRYKQETNENFRTEKLQ